jgi:FkbM family methyltransferase
LPNQKTLKLNKITTYSRYLFDYLKHNDLKSVLASIKYIVNKSSHSYDRIISTSIGTFYCRKNTNDFQFANMYYEWGVKKWILKRKDKFSVFIDGGACIGDYCVLLSKMNKKCFAFELVPVNIRTLKKNLELNDLQNVVKLFPYGLGDADYSTGFTFDPVNTGASRINKVKKSASENAEIRKLDTLMDEMAIGKNEHIFIKLDVEGMEAEAIRGASEFIKYYQNITLIIEDKHSGIQSIKETLGDIALFEFGKVDKLNMYAKKINNH